MQKIKIIETGYFHPSNANWSYHVFMIIDETGARLYKTTFGSEQSLKLRFEVDNLYPGIGTDTKYAGRTVAKLPLIEDYTGFNWGEKSFKS